MKLTHRLAQDPCLRPVAERLLQDANPWKVLCLDFFDTLGFRMCQDPVSVFIETGRRLLQNGRLSPHIDAYAFAQARTSAAEQATFRAIITSDHDQPSLRAIYEEMDALLPDIEIAMATERQVELDWSWVNPFILDLAALAKARGLKVAILSDMYLSPEDLVDILSQSGVGNQLFDWVQTSASLGAGKEGGGAYARLIEHFQVPPKEILMVGDNHAADVVSARKAGLDALHYATQSRQLHEIYRRERQSWRVEGSRHNPLAPLRSFVLQFHQVARTPDFDDGASVLGPPLARFADWCVQEFSNAGISRVVTITREGPLLARLLTKSAKAQGIPLDISAIHVSRQSVQLASMGRPDAVQLRALCEYYTLGEMLNFLGFKPDEIHVPAPLQELSNNTPLRMQLVTDFLTQPDLLNRIEQRSKQERETAAAYLAENFGEHSQVGVVDIGWTGSTQKAIREILRLSNIHTSLCGRYLFTCEKGAVNLLHGLDMKGFMSQFGSESSLMDFVGRACPVLEQPLSSWEGTTLGYEFGPSGSPVPILAPPPYDAEEVRRRKKVHAGVDAFQSLWLAFQARHSTRQGPGFLNSVDAWNKHILYRVLAHPLPEEALRYGSWTADKGARGKDEYVPLHNDQTRALLDDGEVGRLFLREGNVVWPQGVVASQLPHFAEAVCYGWLNPTPLWGLKIQTATAHESPKISELTDQDSTDLLKNWTLWYKGKGTERPELDGLPEVVVPQIQWIHCTSNRTQVLASGGFSELQCGNSIFQFLAQLDGATDWKHALEQVNEGGAEIDPSDVHQLLVTRALVAPDVP